jgi:hypothetical protein
MAVVHNRDDVHAKFVAQARLSQRPACQMKNKIAIASNPSNTMPDGIIRRSSAKYNTSRAGCAPK